MTGPGELAEWVDPAACTLPDEERPLRVAELDELFATSLVSAVVVGHHARLVLDGAPGLLARVSDLTARETACCSFFTFTVTRAPSRGGSAPVHLDVVVPPARAGVLRALVSRARSLSGGRWVSR